MIPPCQWLVALAVVLTSVHVRGDEPLSGSGNRIEVQRDALEQSEPVPPVVQALSVGIQRWKESATFRCNFTFVHGYGLEQEKVARGEFCSVLDGKPYSGESGRGFVAKSQDRFRYRYDPDQHLAAGVTDLSQRFPYFDIAVVDGKQWRYRARRQVKPSREMVGGTVDFSIEEDQSLSARFPSMTEMYPMPLFACGGFGDEPFLSLTPRKGLKEKVSWRVSKVDSARVRILAIRTGVAGQDQWEDRTEYTVRTEYPLPFIERVRHRYRNSNGASLRQHLDANELVDCGNGVMIPSSVVQTTELQASSASNENRLTCWRANIWKSDDLKGTQPLVEDFVLTVPERTNVRGLVTTGSRTVFNLLDLPKSDMVLRAVATSARESNTTPASVFEEPRTDNSEDKPTRPSWTALFVALIVIGAALYSGIGARSSRQADGQKRGIRMRVR